MAVRRSLARSFPSLFVAALVVLAAQAGSRSAGPRPFVAGSANASGRVAASSAGRVVMGDAGLAGPEPATCATRASSFAPADAFVQAPPGDDLWAIQPGAITVTAAGFSLAPLPAGPATFTAEVLYFDAGSATGDPFFGTVALARTATASLGSGPEWLDYSLGRPIIMRPVDGLAVAATPTAALALRAPGPDPHAVGFAPEGPSSLGPAVFATRFGTFDPLPGPHPVLAHQVCAGAVEDEDLRVLQEALLANGSIPTATAELVQTFTVPITVTADWVELAVRTSSTTHPVEVSLYDPQGLAMPGPGPLAATATATTIDADFGRSLLPPVWTPTLPLAQRARLEPNHVYWLQVRTNSRWALHSASQQGGAGFPGGELYFRNGSTGAFTLSGSNDLSFRLIGTADFGDPGPPPVCIGGSSYAAPTATATLGLGNDLRVAQAITIRGANFGSSLRSFSVPARSSGDAVTLTAVAAVAGPLGEPDPGKVALRATPIAVTTTAAGWADFASARPLVVRSVTGTAEVSTEMLSMRLIGGHVTATAEVGYDDASTEPSPPLLRQIGDGPWLPVAGDHPVLAHATCETDPLNGVDLPYAAVQQILSASETVSATSTYEVIQSLRVPYAANLDWLEVARSVTQTAVLAPLEIEVIAPRSDSPLLGLDGAVIATFTADYSVPDVWTGTATFRVAEPASGGRPVLTPGVDYWLRYRTNHQWDLPASPVTVTAYSGGRLYTKASSSGPYAEDPLRNLAFRLIGVMRDVVGGPSPVTLTAMVAGHVTVTATVPVLLDRRVSQPIAVTATAALGALYLPLIADGGGVTLTATIRAGVQGPLGSVPREDTYAFGAVTVTATTEADWRGGALLRPLVLQSVTGTAEASTAADLHVVLEEKTAHAARAKVGFDPAAAVSSTAALREAPGFGWEQLPGPLAVLGHVVTRSPGPDADRLRALQQMLTLTRACCNVTVTPCCFEASVEKIQTFQVPVAGRADWVELAIPGGHPTATAMEVAILDPGTEIMPRAGILVATATATLEYHAGMADQSAWTASARFASPPHLEPGRDYWLLVRTGGEWRLGIAADYQDGRLFYRETPDGPWTEQPGEDLGFRIIGVPDDLVAVESSPPRPRAFQLAAGPNPFTRDVAFRWSGGSGRVRIEVFDIHGRRVRHVRDAGDANEGAWSWRGEADRGDLLGAGVYFARVTVAGARPYDRRVVLVR
jgi:hypothetical protein